MLMKSYDKEAKYHAVKLIKQKKSHFYKKKLKETIGKPNELLKALKSLGLPSKKVTISNICLKKDGKLCFVHKANANAYKELLPLISKIIEKVIHYQTQAFLNENKILYRF